MEELDEQRRKLVEEILFLRQFESVDSCERMEAFVFRYLPHLFKEMPGRFHREIYADLERMLWGDPIQGRHYDTAAYAYPRGHGKTTTCVQGLILWVLHEWRNMPHFRGEPPFILIVSDTSDQARDRLLDIRDELESNLDLHAHYGSRVPDAKRRRKEDDEFGEGPQGTFKWTELDFQTTDGCRVKAVGTGSKIRGLLRRGRRPTLIVCDDLENDEHVSTRAQRDKLTKWVMKALIPCGIEGLVLTVVVGTILHADSVLSRLLDPTEYVGWLKRRYAAAWDDAGLPNAEGPNVLWPEFWPLHRLQARREKIGSVAFTQEYLNQAVDDLTALFKWAWLEAALARGKGTPFLYGPVDVLTFEQCISSWDVQHLGEESAGLLQLLVTAWDVSLVPDEKEALEKDSDYTWGMSVGLTLDDRFQILRHYRKRGMTPNEVRGRIIAENRLLLPNYVVVENNTASMAHEIELRGVYDLPLKGHTTDQKKHSVYEGVPGLCLLLEQNRMDLCWNTVKEKARQLILRDELHGLGRERHDDGVMALWMAVVTIRKWQRLRDHKRRQLLGPPPNEYRDPTPHR